MPALTWIAVPPAKSSEPRSPSQPPKIHLKIGTYTSSSQTGTNTAQARNFMRSATAPEMSAGVMTANIPRNAIVAIWPPPSSRIDTLRSPSHSKLPIQFPLPPWDSV